MRFSIESTDVFVVNDQFTSKLHRVKIQAGASLNLSDYYILFVNQLLSREKLIPREKKQNKK